MSKINKLCHILEICKNSSKKKLLSFKKNNSEWISFSSQEFYYNSFYFACGLREIGLKNGDKIGIFSYQNPIWVIVDMGSILAGAVTVPIFYNISENNLLYQIKDSDLKYIFSDNILPIEKSDFSKINLLENKVSKIVKKIITFDFDIKDGCNFDYVIKIGKEAAEMSKYSFKDFCDNINEDDLATIIYTSGSTGNPKGVALSHKNLSSQINDTATRFILDSNLDKALSFLPLAHVFERMVMMFYITKQIEIYFVDNIKNISQYLKEVRPSLMTVVPRLLEKVYSKIKDGVETSSFLKRTIAKLALKRALKKNIDTSDKFFDKIYRNLIYKKFLGAFGGSMKMIICGGASLSSEMEKFFINIGINLYCGYGLTETSPVIAVNYPNNYRFATVGKIYPSLKVKIADDSELMVSGDGVMIGYYNDKERTREVFDGIWFKTGDLAQIDEDGYLKIIGRKKELFKTANGKYVRPVPIEQKLVQEFGFLSGAIIIAENRNFVSCLLFPDFENLSKIKKTLSFDGAEEYFLSSNILLNHVKNIIDKINLNLDHHENIQKFHIVNENISIANGDITPSMKLRRSILEEKYKEIIKDFYQ